MISPYSPLQLAGKKTRSWIVLNVTSIISGITFWSFDAAMVRIVAPDIVDAHVGRRVRLRRQYLAMSQATLAQAIKLTFQQVQKYEHGANRISASMLFRIASKLEVSIDYFFDGLADKPQGLGNPEADAAALAAAIAVPSVRHIPDLSREQQLALEVLLKGLVDRKKSDHS